MSARMHRELYGDITEGRGMSEDETADIVALRRARDLLKDWAETAKAKRDAGHLPMGVGGTDHETLWISRRNAALNCSRLAEIMARNKAKRSKRGRS